MKSTTKWQLSFGKIYGFLFSLMSVTIFGQSVTISPNNTGTAIEGRMYYDNVSKDFRYWNGTTNVLVGSSATAGSSSWAVTGANLYNLNSGNVGVGINTPSSRLTVSHSSSNMLALWNTAGLSAGLSNSISFGGSNYTTGIISTIGTSSSAARMGFFTGYSFSGGVSNLQERLSISNTGNVGVGQTNPAAKLDVGGTIRFSGSNPAAFVITAELGVNSYDIYGQTNPVLDVSGTFEAVRIDHPMCNNNPNAILMVTAQVNNFGAVEYKLGYWYLVPSSNQKIYLRQACAAYSCTPSSPTFETYTINDTESETFYDGNKFNVLIIQN